MSLNIILATPSAIHQCSDYRLTDPRTGTIVRENVGAKQVESVSLRWSVKVCFTGIVSVASYKTREWIDGVFTRVDPNTTLQELLRELVESGNASLKALQRDLPYRELTLSVGAAEKQRLRLFMISNCQLPDGRPMKHGPETLQLFELTLKRPRSLFVGRPRAVSRQDRKLVQSLGRRGRDAGAIRRALAEVNARASEHRESHESISQDCMVSSLFPTGHSQGKHFGGAEGIPDFFVGPFNMGEWLRNHVKPAPGKKVRLDATSTSHLPPSDADTRKKG